MPKPHIPVIPSNAASTTRPRATGRVTLADVAQAAGVSPITVSRALRSDRGVAADLVARVQAAARKLGYVPDPAARALASRHSSHVAVLIPLLSNALFVDLLEAVQRSLRAAGYQTLIGVTHYDSSEEEQLLRGHLLHRPAGMLLTGFERPDSTQALIAASGVPCVYLMETATQPGVYSVGLSQADAASAMTTHLLDRGYHRIAFAAAQLDARTLQRLAGWRRTLAQAGRYDATLEWRNPEPSSHALGEHMFAQIRAQTPRVDAIFFNNDDLAQGALLAAVRMGVRVPQEVAIAGFNDLSGSAHMPPALTTVRTPRAEIGQAACSMLLQLMRGETPPQQCVDVGFQLVVRGST
jgi:LacI family transcriptional regulator, gluconate utilization system Gnt-I transcriptional repressor